MQIPKFLFRLNNQKQLLLFLVVFILLIAILCKYTNIPLSPFMNYNASVSGILIAAFNALIFPNEIKTKKQKIFFACTSTLAFIVLSILKSRIGLVCFACSLWIWLFITKNNQRRKWLWLISTLISLLILVLSLSIKQQSTEGRFFIWQNTLAALTKTPFFGNGINSFRQVYNNEQYNWFLQNGLQNKQAYLAGNVYYAFNEWLQLAIEIGLIPMLLLLSIIMILALLYYKKVASKKIHQYASNILTAFTVLLIGSFFSYPFYYLPTLLLFIILLLIMCYSVFSIYGHRNSVKIFIIILTCFATGYCYFQLAARLNWQNAILANSFGRTRESILKFQEALPILNRNGDFLYTFAIVLSETMQNDEAIIFLNQSLVYKNDFEVHRKIGLLYLQKKQYSNAEFHLKKAVYLIPNKFKSCEALLDYYIATKDSLNVKYWARYITDMNEKVPSITTISIKNKAMKILKTY